MRNVALMVLILMAGTAAYADDTVNLLGTQAQLVAAAPVNSGRTSYSTLLSAARGAQSNASRDCYRTAVRTAQINGARGDGWSWPEYLSYRGQSLLGGLRKAIENGVLKPGMVIYANLRPGTDPSSMNLANKPHWFTYLGKDASGKPRFSDQYATDFDLSGPRGIAATYGSRVIDAFYDPYYR